MIKKHYEIPESELITVRFEENIMSYGDEKKPGQDLKDDDYGDFS